MDQELDVSATLAGLSPADQKDVAERLQKTQQQAQVSEMVHALSTTCFRKCISGKISSDALSSGEQACTVNCVGRWLDTQTSIIKNLSGQPMTSPVAHKKGFFG